MMWHRLDRDKTLDMINSVKSSGAAALFSPITSEAKCARLPFYPNHLFYRVTNYATMPVFSMDFIGDGEKFFYIDGSEKPITTINQQYGLVLNENTIIPYINFYFYCVRHEDGDIMVLKTPAEAAEIDMYDEERREDFNAVPAGTIVHHDTTNDSFYVDVPLYYGGGLLEARLTVRGNGHVSITAQKTVASRGEDATRTTMFY